MEINDRVLKLEKSMVKYFKKMEIILNHFDDCKKNKSECNREVKELKAMFRRFYKWRVMQIKKEQKYVRA